MIISVDTGKACDKTYDDICFMFYHVILHMITYVIKACDKTLS